MDKAVKIEVTKEQITEAVSCYALLEEAERQQSYATILQVPEFGQTVAEHFQAACKMARNGRYPKDRLLDAVVVPSFLIGLLVRPARASSVYCVFEDTGERRLPKPREWYFYTKATQVFPVYYGLEITLCYEAKEYGILRIVEP